jgi:ClpP class serine protease
MRQRFLEASRQRLIARIERKRNSRVILLVHRQETMSVLGFPLFRYIDVNDSEEVLRAIHLTDPDIPLDLVLHVPSGLSLASEQIARAVQKRKGKVTAVVPHRAMSNATLIALAADEVLMTGSAVLGPVDPKLAGVARVRELLGGRSGDREADELAQLLSDEITCETLQDFGIPARSDIPAEFLDLMNLYPQGVRLLSA